jgi:2,4-dienoyl-CoA reductase [(3E)-enoyl-CoA-producing], peroxisomal
MNLGANAAILGRNAERLEASAKELSNESGKICLPLQADVRKMADLDNAARKTVEKFGKIDFVICGMNHTPLIVTAK